MVSTKSNRQSRLLFRQAVEIGAGAVLGAGYIYDKTQKQSIRNRVMKEYALVYILEGGGIYQDVLNGKKQVTQGDVLLIFPDLAHSYYKSGSPIWSECFLTFQGNIFHQLEQAGLLNRNQPVCSLGIRPNLVSSFDRLIGDFFTSSAAIDHVLSARVYLLLAEILHLRNLHSAFSEHEFTQKACALLEENLTTTVDLESIARRLKMSYEGFAPSI